MQKDRQFFKERTFMNFDDFYYQTSNLKPVVIFHDYFRMPSTLLKWGVDPLPTSNVRMGHRFGPPGLPHLSAMRPP